MFSMNGSVSRMKDKLKLERRGEALKLANTVVFANPGGFCLLLGPNSATGAINYNGFAVIGGTVSTPCYFLVGGYLRF